MPTYEYRCPEGHDFDVFQRMSDPPEAECPTCGKAAERRISAGAGFLFKGSGFYITDSRSAEYSEKAKAEKGGSSGDSGSSGSSGTSSTTSEGSGKGSAGGAAKGSSSAGSSGGGSGSTASSDG